MDHWSKSWFLPLFFLIHFSFGSRFSKAADTLYPGQSLSGNQTIVSQGGIFELGFFTPGNISKNFYIGIWYKQIPVRAVVWIANRDHPISETGASELKISEDGNLVLTQSKIQVWSSNVTTTTSSSTVAVLLDTGNLVLRNSSNSSAALWQSFDHPTDTWLPNQKLGLNRITGKNQLVTSWRNLEDPSTGLFSEGIDPKGTDQYFLWRNGTEYWTTGLWNGKIFANIPDMSSGNYLSYVHVSNERENYFTYTFRDTSTISRLVMDVTGQAKILKWIESSQKWLWVCLLPSDPCSVPSLCGAFGSCSLETVPFCSCLEGFKPQSSTDWNLSDWSGGCVRRTPLQCFNSSVNTEKDVFLTISDVHLPTNSQNLEVGTAEECESACLKSCFCTAYSYSSTCLIWNGDLYDLKKLSNGPSNRDSGVLYLRLAASDLPSKHGQTVHRSIMIIIGAVAGSAFCLLAAVALIWKFQSRHPIGLSEEIKGSLVLFRYKNLVKATNNFSEKLGAGSFGTVYKGTLCDSTLVAVKRLGRTGQGEKQFRAEVSTIGQVRHVNLVGLRGFCFEGSERLLVYDYMPNGSLGSQLFQKKSKILDWTTRFQIALGTARGLAYLHGHCRDCIIHCDIKPENILLDSEFSPKVADFGMAKLIGREFSRVLTTMRGTLGYLAPEWISGLAITPKADVYSYGMMLLEIISGRRNAEVSEDGDISFFPLWAASKVKEDKILSLLDYRLEGKANVDELRRACRVAVWCIQGEESHRPTMSLVVQILEGVSEVNMPPIPKQLYSLVENQEDMLSSTATFGGQT
ncbi:G-type lectin S-receptor-like serine/threonine-protein kinase At2g19130 [Elaeis guineensis]|uniref:Receptor-like serine/threonine-protein kinase n=2 Tax=Elaeis guineensis var. tenera TaxID=51953 RepID=A0A6I9RKG5_ELAGV|nr:G-type lectin S-receptor-like serine/threonine-protein kinase At2g19130 isoform X1 [Elaeis guineensis]